MTKSNQSQSQVPFRWDYRWIHVDVSGRAPLDDIWAMTNPHCSLNYWMSRMAVDVGGSTVSIQSMKHIGGLIELFRAPATPMIEFVSSVDGASTLVNMVPGPLVSSASVVRFQHVYRFKSGQGDATPSAPEKDMWREVGYWPIPEPYFPDEPMHDLVL
jgi:hypothetical protein